MTVYVDDMKADFEPGHRPGRKYVMSHMIADTDEELHEMADRIGVARKWFQGDHYDITQSKKRQAIWAGAVLITQRECATMSVNRRCGFPLGTPQTCFQIRDQRRAEQAKRRPPLCVGCGVNRSDPPSRFCPACQAYREHQS